MTISRGERADYVYRRLREQIVRGTLAPGARLVEQEVAAALGVGRTPVREALQMLVQAHLVVTAPGGRRQLSVAPLRADEARELFGLAAELEGAALRLLPTLSAPERSLLVKDARRANRDFAAAVAAVPLDSERAFTSHQAFHATLVDRLAGPRLAWLLGLLRPQVERYEWYYGGALEGSLAVATAEHEAVIAALAADDGAAAADAVRTNWINAGERLATAIERAAE